MKRILFTIQWFPSVFSANALCDEKVMKELLCLDDVEIHCLCYRPFNAKSDELLNGVYVHRFTRSFWWNVFVWAKQKSNENRLANLILRLNKIIMRVNQLITIPFYPDTAPLISRKFARKAVKLNNLYHFDMVISEFHGLDSLHAGRMLKEKNPSIVFLPILWDAFTGKELAKYLPKVYASSKMEKAEARELTEANAIIAMESSRDFHLQYSTQKSYFKKIRFLDIPGIVQPAFTNEPSMFVDKEKINIVYAGILSLPDRDPEFIVKALNNTSFAERINLIYLCTGAGKEKLEKLKQEFDGEIIINGYVEREQLRAIYRDADIFLNQGGTNPYMVPSKIFEYLSYGKPIISVSCIDDDSSEPYLERFPLALCLDSRKTVEDVTSELEFFIKTSLGKHEAFDEIAKEFWGNTPKAYVDLINDFLD